MTPGYSLLKYSSFTSIYIKRYIFGVVKQLVFDIKHNYLVFSYYETEDVPIKIKPPVGYIDDEKIFLSELDISRDVIDILVEKKKIYLTWSLLRMQSGVLINTLITYQI